MRRGLSKKEAEALARIGTAYLGESSSSEKEETAPPSFNIRLTQNTSEVGNIERALKELDTQRKRKKGMGAEAKRVYDAEELKLTTLLRSLRGQNTLLTEGKDKNLPAEINISNADRRSIESLNRGDQLLATKGGARSGAGRKQTQLTTDAPLQQRFEDNQTATRRNLEILNGATSRIREIPRIERNVLIGEITMRNRGRLLRAITGRTSQDIINDIMSKYDAILENKRLERLYRKDARD